MSPEYLEGTQGPFHNLVDYILGITHEIWESRFIERVHDYYSPEVTIWALGGVVRGPHAVVQNTYETLRAFPDRLLLADGVIWRRESQGVFYSSHRIGSPMTNLGPSAFGPTTGRRVFVRTIADCLVRDGMVVREWLVRDNYSLVKQLGLDVQEVAREQAARAQPTDLMRWLNEEDTRLRGAPAPCRECFVRPDYDVAEFCKSVLENHWIIGDQRAYELQFAPYAVLHDSAPIASGRTAIAASYAAWRAALTGVHLGVDHVCSIPSSDNGCEVAARWMLVGNQCGELLGLAATGARIVVLGVTHWQIVAGKIAAEWTIFDRLALLTQILRTVNR